MRTYSEPSMLITGVSVIIHATRRQSPINTMTGRTAQPMLSLAIRVTTFIAIVHGVRTRPYHRLLSPPFRSIFRIERQRRYWRNESVEKAEARSGVRRRGSLARRGKG